MDPKWQISLNELSFHNSVKMKLSVILGVFHMLFGIVLKGLNCLHFKNRLGFVFEFIPQIIFMSILFGYMDFMIFIKWIRDWSQIEKYAPSLISLLMNVFLKMGSVDGMPLWEEKNDANKYSQETFNFIVLCISLICVPIMLFPKPLMEYYNVNLCCGKKTETFSNDEHPLKEENDEDFVDLVKDYHEEKHSLGDIFVHQTIETIEFVLGAISNTASYLRLWALSLAHGQLSRVFFEKSIQIFLNSESIFLGVIMLTVGFFIFINITFGVLMSMDLLECFLHTLRLHWVEFQNKFYKADGYKFTPFSFKQLLNSHFEN
jgi:V-type H+-transporting ATPase subunit a